MHLHDVLACSSIPYGGCTAALKRRMRDVTSINILRIETLNADKKE
jgi:hypothetical protein